MNRDSRTVERPASTADVVRDRDGRAPTEQGTQRPEQPPLLPRDLMDRMRSEWNDVQASFVDEPRQAVRRADEMVAFAIRQIAETFARERSQLEAQWDRDGDVSTEDLRVALTRYRSFFQRLLSI
ncbi:MAG: hypothetical protein SFV54_13865 [Bryobacteraceae bacterium]|nr:hypothetical protein [Bryobacteraceae bacterium]